MANNRTIQNRAGRASLGKVPERLKEAMEMDPASVARAAAQRRFAGSEGLCRDEVLKLILQENNLRVRPVVDLPFLRLWLFRFAQAMASENWEQVLETARLAAAEAASVRTSKPRRDEIMAMPLAMTTIPMRTLGFLESDGIHTIADLLQRTRQQLLAIPQFGPHCLQHCVEAMRELGFGSQEVP